MWPVGCYVVIVLTIVVTIIGSIDLYIDETYLLFSSIN